MGEPENKLIIYKASAGTGKTYTLVKEYLKLLIKRPAYYQNILAITFTNAATLEMKTRIIESLEKLSKETGSELAIQIRMEIKAEDKTDFEESDIRNNARKALSNILNNYSRFEISTIDAFFNRLVRSMARELNLPLRYDIELEPDNALHYAIHQLYEMDDEEGRKVWDWLEEFAFSRIEDEKGWKIDRDILRIGSKIFDEKLIAVQGEDDISDALQQLRDESSVVIRSFENHIIELAEKAISLIEDSGVKTEWFYGGKSRSIANNFWKLAEGENFDAPVKTLSKIITRESSWYAAKSMFIDKIESLAQNGLNQITEDIHNHYQENVREYHTARLIERNIYAYALLNALKGNLKKYRDENNVLFLSDNASVIHGILQKDDTPFVFEKTGSYYKHIFIDEFQDTSEFQWKNLLPLVINALSDATESHRVFIVGDVKQSIYRWRGGDMSLLMKGVEEDLRNYSSVTEVRDLKDNYRSYANVVRFNNGFFNFCSARILEQMAEDPEVYRVEEVYGKLDQNPKKEKGGHVSIHFFQDGESRWKEQSKEVMVAKIQELLGNGYRKAEFLVLTSTNQEANDVANHLINKGIDVISQSSLLLNNIPVIQVILNLLAYLNHNDDQIARCGAIYWYKKIKKIRKEIDYERIRKENSYFLDLMPDEFSTKIKSLSRKPVYELIEELIVLYHLDQEAGIFLQTFKELALEHTGTGLVSIGQFLEWWYEEDRELAVTSTAELNAVKVMTIHKSKGLEAPVVFIPFCNFYMNSSRETVFWTDRLEGDLKEFKILPIDFKEEARESAFESAYLQENIEQYLDTLNKTYVAFSRARDQLYIFSQKFAKHDETKINSVSRLLWSYAMRQPGWNELEANLNIGLPETKEKEEKKEEDLSLGFFKILGQSYMEKVNIRNYSMNYYLLKDSTISKNVELGIKRHELLSRLKAYDDLEDQIALMRLEGYLNDTEAAEIKADVDELMENELFLSWFQPGWEVFAEVPIFSHGEVYQPDRVLIGENEVFIIDYKKEVQDPKHEKQVRNYEKLLQEMGYSGIRKFLVYMDERIIKEVDE